MRLLLAPSDAAFRTPNYAPQPESAAVARAVDLMHTGEESEDDGFGDPHSCLISGMGGRLIENLPESMMQRMMQILI
jgi:hypothetical protein